MEFTISKRKGLREEGERAFLHSNVGLVPESQSFELSGNDENSTGYKLQNQKVEEYENSVSVHLKKNEGGLDRSPYDMKSADCMATPKLDFCNSLADLEKDCEARLKDDLDILRFSIKSFMNFPNDIELFKRFPSSPISDSLDEIDSIENSSVDVYMDEALSKCEAEEVDSYKESNYVVKDICVKERVLTKNKVILENSVDGKAHNFFPYESYKNKVKPKVQLKDLMLEDEDVTEKHFVNVNKKMVLPEEEVLMQDLGTQKYVPSKDKGKQVSSEPEIQSLSVLASPTWASEMAESNFDNNGMFWNMKCHQVGCKCNEIQNTSMAVNAIDEGVTSEVHRDSIGELSFSALCTVPYSGSISIRSDYSTSSSGSFAFPILQSEWINNQVNMPETERKHRGWRQVLLCCRF